MPLKRTPLRRVSNKKLEEREAKRIQKEKDNLFFLEIWRKKPHNCESCGQYLGKEPLSTYFDHLLEKEMYPDLRYEEANLMLVCFQCHGDKGMGHPTEVHRKMIEKAKQYFNK